MSPRIKILCEQVELDFKRVGFYEFCLNKEKYIQSIDPTFEITSRQIILTLLTEWQHTLAWKEA